MPLPIQDYALITDCHTGALVGLDGSIDRLCFPRCDSAAVFAALLGGPEEGRWLLAPVGDVVEVSRQYLKDTFILQTTWRTGTGVVTVTDFMPFADRQANVLRRVTGVEGTVIMRQELIMRFGYGQVMPWVQRARDSQGNNCLLAMAGPDAVAVHGELPRGAQKAHRGEFSVTAGENKDVMLVWYPSYKQVQDPVDVDQALAHTQAWWKDWSDMSRSSGPYADQVERSLLVLRGLTHEDAGGIVAAATTSLPEKLGGQRNWDYRYCWLRDAALTMNALISHGYSEEVHRWRNWLLRAVAGDPEDVQIMYGLSGERDLPEHELAHLPGYLGSTPVRVGNGAVDQFQADVVGEVLVSLARARDAGVGEDTFSWALQKALVTFVENQLDRKDSGIWEIRGEEQYFTHSRAMIWAAFNSVIHGVDDHGLAGPVEHWREMRDRLSEEILSRGFDHDRKTFTQYYGGAGTDASLLVLAQVGFCGYDDPKMLGTVAAMESELLHDGLLLRYRTERNVDGLPPGEHPFLACSFWLVEQYAHTGRLDDAHRLMDRLVSFANDVGLLSEEYDTSTGRQMGNTPQALSHLTMVRAADALELAAGNPGADPVAGR
ncbi:MAG: glycoside hydrolase family 15 protein [Propionibacteriaceae bacterium]